MSNCQAIMEMIPEYIIRSTTAKQNAEIIRHISSCMTCRADVALWLSVKHSLQKAEDNSPPINLQKAFIKIPDNETELERILKTGSYIMAFDFVRYVFRTVKSTYRLASLI